MSDNLDSERDELLAEINEAFKDVSRKGGVSWSESEVIDGYGTNAERSKARKSDRDTHWLQLVDDENWQPNDPGTVGGFGFLDAIGFRYYLPPTMVRCLRSDEDKGMISDRLTASFDLSKIKGEPLLDERQSRCIARFLWYMARRTENPDWLVPLDEVWQKFL